MQFLYRMYIRNDRPIAWSCNLLSSVTLMRPRLFDKEAAASESKNLCLSKPKKRRRKRKGPTAIEKNLLCFTNAALLINDY